jgi:organic hydroperoxide reductase OsmC/OhrA
MPSSRETVFESSVRWVGSHVPGQVGGRSYTRDMLIEPQGKPPIPGSAGVRYFGDGSRYNPEDLMLASLAECHLLTYLGLAAKAGIVVVELSAKVSGVLGLVDGKMRFTSATLEPRTRVAQATDVERALALHRDAHEGCFMSNSVNFPISVLPNVEAAPAAGS